MLLHWLLVHLASTHAATRTHIHPSTHRIASYHNPEPRHQTLHALHHAVAEAGAAALALVERLELDGYRYLHATRAELLCRLGRIEEARVAYRRALALTPMGPEHRFLERRLEAL